MKKNMLILFFVFIILITYLGIIIVEPTKSQSSYNFNINSDVIGKISNFNTNNKELDSETDWKRSTLEVNNNEIVDLTIDKLFTSEQIEKMTSKYCYKQDNCSIYLAQPRIIKTTKGLYILTFHTTVEKLYLTGLDKPGENAFYEMNDNGLDVYYTTSTNLKNWTTPVLMYESDYNNGMGINQKDYIPVYGYIFPYILELKNGKILFLSAKWALNKSAYAAQEYFDKNGIYINYGTINNDNSISWSGESQIYKGLVWDPTAIELDNGEIQFYFTSVAPIMYYQASQAQNGGTYYAIMSSLHNSSGVAMMSLMNNTWSYKGVNSNNDLYKNTNTNSYTAYRIIQSSITTKNDKNTPVDFTKIKTKNGLNAYGIKENDGSVVQMGDGMASPLILNNKTMVMPLETTYIKYAKISNDEIVTSYEDPNSVYIKMDLAISLAYSTPQNVSITSTGTNVSKYWLDINNNKKSIKQYTNEQDIYSDNGLAIDEVGPLNRDTPIIRGSGPDIVQFPSGETLLSYHLWPSFQIKIGDSTAHFINEKDNNISCYTKDNSNLYRMLDNKTFCAGINDTNYGGFYWGGLYVDNSHRVLATLTYKNNNGSHIRILPMYLNHTIDSYKNGLSKENDDALFIGSDSQTEETIRSYHDDDYIYFVFDRTDKTISSNDSNGIRIHSDELKYNNKKYNYLRVSFNNKKITKALLGYNGELVNIKGIVEGTFIESKTGYKVIIKIKKEDKKQKFTFISKDTKKVQVFAALTETSSGESIYDTLEGVIDTNMNTWINVNLLEKNNKSNNTSNNNSELNDSNNDSVNTETTNNTSNNSSELNDSNNNEKNDNIDKETTINSNNNKILIISIVIITIMCLTISVIFIKKNKIKKTLE